MTTLKQGDLNKLCASFHNETKLYNCPKCGKELRNFQAELRAKVDAIPRETKQELIDNLLKGNVGEAIKLTDPNSEVEFIVWTTIIADQIENHSYETFNRTVV